MFSLWRVSGVFFGHSFKDLVESLPGKAFNKIFKTEQGLHALTLDEQIIKWREYFELAASQWFTKQLQRSG